MASVPRAIIPRPSPVPAWHATHIHRAWVGALARPPSSSCATRFTPTRPPSLPLSPPLLLCEAHPSWPRSRSPSLSFSVSVQRSRRAAPPLLFSRARPLHPARRNPGQLPHIGESVCPAPVGGALPSPSMLCQRATADHASSVSTATFAPILQLSGASLSTTPPRVVGPHRRRHYSLQSRRASHRLHVDGLLGWVSEPLTLPSWLPAPPRHHRGRPNGVCAAGKHVPATPPRPAMDAGTVSHCWLEPARPKWLLGQANSDGPWVKISAPPCAKSFCFSFLLRFQKFVVNFKSS
jgi:hypothetical protein